MHEPWWMIDLWDALWFGLIGALVFELATVALRFGLGWTSPERTRPIGRLTRGWRIHHGYPGLMLLGVAPMLGFAASGPGTGPLELLVAPAWWGWLLVVGITLALSDLIHHAVVLPLFAGGHEFYLRYPDDRA